MTRPILACLWLVFFTPLAYAQDYDAYQLRSITWLVDGKTNPAAALPASGIHGDEVWEDPAELVRWIEDVQKRLMNTRLFEQVSISYTLSQIPGQETHHVDISIELIDSRNLVLLPRPKYDPGTGLELGLGLRDYNFLGSMQTLKLDFGIVAESIGQPDPPPVRLFFGTEAMATGTIASIRWNLNLIQDLAFDRLLSNQSGTSAGLGFDIPAGEFILSINGQQSFNFNHEIKQFYLTPVGGISDDTWYGSSLIRIGASLPESVSGNPEPAWHYAAGAGYTTGGMMAPTLSWPGFIVVDQSIQSGKLNWSGNFRNGTTIGIFSSEVLDIASSLWLADIMLEANHHQVVHQRMAFSVRLYALQRMYDYAFEDGWLFRGVLDTEISARSLFALSLDVRFFLLSFLPSLWLHDERWSILNFEMQTSLFIDMGIGTGINQNPLFRGSDFVSCLGIEVLIFPLAFKSTFLRLSLGKDMTSAAGSFEPYLGLDLQY